MTQLKRHYYIKDNMLESFKNINNSLSNIESTMDNMNLKLTFILNNLHLIDSSKFINKKLGG
jgi:hypothetical protein